MFLLPFLIDPLSFISFPFEVSILIFVLCSLLLL
uniref:Uncharacterized protein n=1 Tax=Rhizophora mucronata TaxID=61149 RepID=A0A2P2IRN2_RHIMU